MADDAQVHPDPYTPPVLRAGAPAGEWGAFTVTGAARLGRHFAGSALFLAVGAQGDSIFANGQQLLALS